MPGCYGALRSEKSVTLVALTVPLLAAPIPLIDVVLSILRRFLRNRPSFQTDRKDIHHRLLDLGLSKKERSSDPVWHLRRGDALVAASWRAHAAD